MKQFIAAFDIATSTGCADGFAGSKPRTWTWDVSAAKSRPFKLEMLLSFAERYFGEVDHAVDAVWFEKGLSLGAAFEIGMSDETMALLRGAIGIFEATAARFRIPVIEGVSVQEARKFLLGSGRIPKGMGKKLVRERCRVLGWKVANDDEADASCIWAYGCGQANPLVAHMTTPLFGGV